MSSVTDRLSAGVRPQAARWGRTSFALAALCVFFPVMLSALAFAEEPRAAPNLHQRHAPMVDQDGTTVPTSPPTEAQEMESQGMDMEMDMGSMQGSSAPPEARDPNAYAEGFEYSGMPGMEKADRISVSKLLVDQLEFVSGDEGKGVAWDIHLWHGPDEQKLLLRSEGGSVNGGVDFSTGAEALWWRAFSPFWASVLGVRQEFGPGSHTHLAFGVEGLAPYWFEVEATGYVADDGALSARLKGAYDVLLTNRLILTPEVEFNLGSEAEAKRDVGAGPVNIELSLRLRYEFSRKFAPYVGFDWERALGNTADRRRASGEGVSDAKVVAGMRLWW
ncbi:MAG: copper resistance protein B [Syntrophales bacterium]|nr:copper resistance protein B [Syntrophales bacterium]